MSTITSKVSIQVQSQQPDFIQAEHPDFLQFLKSYYEFMESAELVLSSLGLVASIIQEDGTTSLTATPGTILLEPTNRYRTGEDNTVQLEDYDTVGGSVVRTIGSFQNGETITGTTSKATAIVRCEDVTVGSRLFISSQNKFILGETVTGATSGATGVISSYTANPVENIMQLLEYDDVDGTIDSFFTEFKEAYMRTIPDGLATGLDKRKLLKNIKDLYRAKGTKQGHKLFFRILLDEEVDVTYPTKDMLRVSAGKWTDDTILRVINTNSTILMEDSTDSSEIFILLEDGAQILTEDTVSGTDDLTKWTGQTVTMAGVTDLSIDPGGAYASVGYPTISTATAVVDSVYKYGLSGESVIELILNPDSESGTMYVGHTLSGLDNTDLSRTLNGKITSIIDKADLKATNFQSSQYFATTDPIAVTADAGTDALVAIETITSGTINEIIVDSAGSGYAIGDVLTVNNANTNGVDLAGEVSIVNGGIAAETGTLDGEFRIFNEEVSATVTALVLGVAGTGYTTAPTVTLGPPPTTSGTTTTQATATATVSAGAVTGFSITNAGAGYVATPSVTITGGGGSGATATSTISFGSTMGEMILNESKFTYETPTGIYQIGETITGLTSSATGTVVEIALDTKTVTYNAVSGTFTLGEEVLGGTSAYKSTLLTNTVTIYLSNEENLGMVAADRFILEEETVNGDAYTGRVIVQQTATGNGDITNVRVTREGYGYTDLPLLTLPTTGSRTGGSVKAKGTDVGKIDAVNIINQGIHFTDAASLKFNTTTNFLCTSITGTFDPLETVTGGTSGATGRLRSQRTARGIIKLDNLSTVPFIVGETITGSPSGETAVINSFTKTVVPGTIGTSVNRTGRFIGDDGFIDEKTKKIQDSYYYQDYSYVVKSATSIGDWKNDLLAAVHPAGWAVFGSVDIATLLQQIANITSVTGLGPIWKMVFHELLGMRLGTTDQGPINPNPMVPATEPSDGTGKIYNPALKLNAGSAFTTYETITGGTSLAVGKFLSESTEDAPGAPGAGVRIALYLPISGIFEDGETITGGTSSVTAVVSAVWGLKGFRDRTLNHVIQITLPAANMTGASSGARPDYGDISRFSFRPSMVDTRISTRTFTPNSSGAAAIPVYLANLPLTTLATGINNSATSIVATSATNFPTVGTIQIEDELIDYTGISTNTFTGCTRGQHSTSAAAHSVNVRLDAVQWAQKQNLMPGYKMQDWLRGQNYESLTFSALANVQTKNKIGPQIQLTMYKT